MFRRHAQTLVRFIGQFYLHHLARTAAAQSPPSPAPKSPFPGVRRKIEFRDVSFKYGNRPLALDQVTLDLPAGKTIALAGESGAGKSTLVELLQGSFDTTAGRILVDGVNVKDFDRASLRHRVVVVTQDGFLFNGTLRQNLTLGRQGVSTDDLHAAARAAGLHDLIMSFPEQYDTVLGEHGENLSGGQRQRLAIARALLRQPDVLVLDEATSQLDTAAERAVHRHLRQALAGKTLVLVSHRLSTIRDVDAIYVLHRGRIVERGQHAQLLQSQGHYASLVRAQADAIPSIFGDWSNSPTCPCLVPPMCVV